MSDHKCGCGKPARYVCDTCLSKEFCGSDCREWMDHACGCVGGKRKRKKTAQKRDEPKLSTIIDQEYYRGMTLLELAIESKSPLKMRIMMSKGANPNVRGSDVRNVLPLSRAVFVNDHRLVATLLDYEDTDVNAVNPDSTSALHIAASVGNEGIVSILLKADANPEKGDENGVTPLYYALNAGKSAAAMALVNGKANLNLILTSNPGFSPLFVALLKCKDAAEPLIRMGADIQFRSFKSKNGTTALHLASELCYPNIVRLLLDMGAVVDAIEDNDEAAREFRISGGLSYGVGDVPSRVTPLVCAVAVQCSEAVELLLNKEANPNFVFEPRTKYNIPRWYDEEEDEKEEKDKMEKGYSEGTLHGYEKLEIKHASVKVKFPTNIQTVLHLAAILDGAAIVQILLSHGALADNLNETNETPLQFAIRHGKLKAASVLAKHTSHPMLTWPSGHTLISQVLRVASDSILRETEWIPKFADITIAELAAAGANPLAYRIDGTMKIVETAYRDGNLRRYPRLRAALARAGAIDLDELYDLVSSLRAIGVDDDDEVVEAEYMLLHGASTKAARFSPYQDIIYEIEMRGRARRTSLAMLIPECVSGSPFERLSIQAREALFSLSVHPEKPFEAIGKKIGT